ncbi:MAG TPA: hypothetical protein VHT27_12770 [Solirubrobacteraceae bacterium]|nr:hypothetical protein [Solirubrobacteraceae bacterium]
MAQRKTLTEKQVLLLRWIADGCRDGASDDGYYRISAAALRNRGLVKTAGRGPTWTATITEAGSEYLAKVDGPDPPVPREANVSVTEQLVNDVVSVGGVLRVPRRGWYSRDGVDYENRARMAARHGKVPNGKRLTVTAINRELEIRLVDAPGRRYDRAELAPVVVPERVGRYHPSARHFRERSERHEISREQLARATRIIHAIATEAERRGWSVQGSSESKNGYGRESWTGTKDGHLVITAQEHVFRLRLQEKGVHTRGAWEEEVRLYRNVSRGSVFYRDREYPSGPHDARATGLLVLELNPGSLHGGRQSRFADRQSWTLEERLPHLFREIEERILEAQYRAEDRRIEAEKAAEVARREAEERQRRWRVLMERAAERLLQDHRAAQLREQARRWQEADQIRRYCDAAEARYEDRPETIEWLAWARAHADAQDPLTHPPRTPELSEVALEELEPYFPHGWSAHGPDQGRPRSPYQGW